jgi:putative membrane protein
VPGLISVLGTVLGLVISFRTSTAYERYSEGRKVWASIQLSGRNLAHMIWNHVPNERDANNKPAPSGATDEDAQRRVVQAQIEKKTMINLVHGFAVSVKHMLRNEPGIYYEVRAFSSRSRPIHKALSCRTCTLWWPSSRVTRPPRASPSRTLM